MDIDEMDFDEIEAAGEINLCELGESFPEVAATMDSAARPVVDPLFMLKDRGYFIADSELNMTKSQFIMKYGDNMKREDLVTLKAKRNDNNDQLYIFFPDEAKVGVKTMKMYTNRMKSENVFRAILVMQQNLTPFARTCISEISSKIHLEVLQEAEMLVNIKEHGLVHEHQILTTEEKKTLLERYTVKETHLPRIQVTYPISRYFGIKRRQA